jgi:hypothetical protein
MKMRILWGSLLAGMVWGCATSTPEAYLTHAGRVSDETVSHDSALSSDKTPPNAQNSNTTVPQ